LTPSPEIPSPEIQGAVKAGRAFVRPDDALLNFVMAWMAKLELDTLEDRRQAILTRKAVGEYFRIATKDGRCV
jgi:hypothetical protein